MSKSSSILSFCLAAAAFVAWSANACSPRHAEITDERIEEALQEAEFVVVARIVAVERSPKPGDSSGAEAIEVAALNVIEVIKGARKIGDTIEVRSALEFGPCNRNVRNDPPWIFEFSDRPGLPDRPVALSDTWLIYGRGEQPYDLDSWLTTPMNLGGAAQVETLHRLSREAVR